MTAQCCHATVVNTRTKKMTSQSWQNPTSVPNVDLYRLQDSVYAVLTMLGLYRRQERTIPKSLDCHRKRDDQC